MVLDASLLNIQYYKVRIKGKWDNLRKGVAPSPRVVGQLLICIRPEVEKVLRINPNRFRGIRWTKNNNNRKNSGRYVTSWLLSRKTDKETPFQILDEPVFHFSLSFGKTWIHLSTLWGLSRLGSLTLVWQPVLEKGNWFETLLNNWPYVTSCLLQRCWVNTFKRRNIIIQLQKLADFTHWLKDRNKKLKDLIFYSEYFIISLLKRKNCDDWIVYNLNIITS